MTASRRILVLALAVALPLAGCATGRASGARTTGQLLTGAGFQAEPADTPERLADLQALPPLRLMVRPGDRDLVYTYADPYHCRCLYVGGRVERVAYERLVTQRARDERGAARYWEMWSPWWRR